MKTEQTITDWKWVTDSEFELLCLLIPYESPYPFNMEGMIKVYGASYFNSFSLDRINLAQRPYCLNEFKRVTTNDIRHLVGESGILFTASNVDLGKIYGIEKDANERIRTVRSAVYWYYIFGDDTTSRRLTPEQISVILTNSEAIGKLRDL